MSYSSRNCMVSEEEATKIRRQETQRVANFRKVFIAFEKYVFKKYKRKNEKPEEEP